MPKSYNTRLIQRNHAYTILEVCALYKVHKCTVRGWRKNGLPIDDQNWPPIIMGYDLKNYLDNKQEARKCPLQEDEFYCSKCKRARRSKPDKISFENSEIKLGSIYKKANIIGECEVCSGRLTRFSSDREIKDFIARGVFSKGTLNAIKGEEQLELYPAEIQKEQVDFKEGEETLNTSSHPSLYTHLNKGENK